MRHLLRLGREFSITNRTDNQSLSVGVAAIVSSVIHICIPSISVGIQSIRDNLHRFRILIPLHILNGYHLWFHSIDKLGSTSSSLLVKFHLSMVTLCLRVVLADWAGMEVLHLAIYLLNQLLRVNITNISSNDVLTEVIAINTAYLLVILHCHHWVNDTLQAFLNKTATAKVGSSLNESAILQGELRFLASNLCLAVLAQSLSNMNHLLVSHLPAARHILNSSLDSIIHLIRSVQTLQILSHICRPTLASERETDIVATIDSIHSNLLSILSISTLITAHINASLLQGIYNITWSIARNDSLLKLIKSVRSHKLGFKIEHLIVFLDCIKQLIVSIHPLIRYLNIISLLQILLFISLMVSKFNHTRNTAIIKRISVIRANTDFIRQFQELLGNLVFYLIMSLIAKRNQLILGILHGSKRINLRRVLCYEHTKF